MSPKQMKPQHGIAISNYIALSRLLAHYLSYAREIAIIAAILIAILASQK